MKFCVLGSGSGGNSTYVEHGDSAILIDVGFSCAELERRLAQIDVGLRHIDGIIITHEHGDHTKGLVLAAHKADCPVWITKRAAEKVKWRDDRAVDVQTLQVGVPTNVAGFMVRSAPVEHDCLALALRITAPDGPTLSIATDLGTMTDHVKQLIAFSNGLIIESNHDKTLLEHAPYNDFTKERIRGPRGHLSNDQCAAYLRNDFDGFASYVVLAHLSGKANMPDVARDSAKAALRDLGLDDVTQLVVAEQDSPTNFLAL